MSTVTVDRCIDTYMDYHDKHSKPATILSFSFTLNKFREMFSGYDIRHVAYGDVAAFLELITEGLSQGTKNSRARHISALYNFTKEAFDIDVSNPCSKGIIKKLYKKPRFVPPELADEESINEMIYRADGRDRLMLELMARAAMRIGEVLSITPADLETDANVIVLKNPKSGRERENVQLYKRLTLSLSRYIEENKIGNNEKIFPISYSTAYRMVSERGKSVGINIAPHDLRRHAATHASRSGVPLELVSKVLLRHSDMATTQRYLGIVTTIEANRMMESLYGRS